MKQSLGHRLELRFGTTNFGGCSPLIEGLPMEEYQKLVPGIKVGHYNPDNLRCTDRGNDLRKIMNLSEEWVKAIHKGVDTGNFEYPLICPAVVANVSGTFGKEYISLDNVILDGNSRVAAASLHTSKMPVIVIEEPEDLANVRKLDKTGKFFWYHGWRGGKRYFSQFMNAAYEAENKAQRRGDEFLNEVVEKNNNYWEMKEGTGFYFNPNIFGDLSLKYCIGKAAFQEQLGEPTTRNRYVLEAENESDWWDAEEYTVEELTEKRAGNRRSLQEEIHQHGLKERIAQLVKNSGLKDINSEIIVDGTINFLTCYVTDPESSKKKAEAAIKELVKDLKEFKEKMNHLRDKLYSP